MKAAHPASPTMDAADVEDKCGKCGERGLLFLCENYDRCKVQRHFFCAGLAFPPMEDEDYYCETCAGPTSSASEVASTFECVICFESKPQLEKVEVVGCQHDDDYCCSKCMFVALEDRHKCPLCRRDALAVVQVETEKCYSLRDEDAEGEAEGETEGEEGEEEEEAAPEDKVDAAIREMRNGALTLDLDRQPNSPLLDDDDVKRIAAELKYNTTLTVLNLNGNRITRRGAKALATALRDNSTLLCLHLDGNELDDRAAANLAASISSNLTLRLLTLRENEEMGREGAAALREASKARPRLKVIAPWHAEEEEEEEMARRRRKRRRREEEDHEDEDEDEDEAFEREREEELDEQLNAAW